MHQSIDSRPGRHPDNSISVSVHARTHTALHCTALRRTSKSMHFNGTTVHTCAFTSAVQRVCINRPLQSARPYIYRQACAKRSHAGIVFTQWSKNRFFCPTGATLCPDKREIWHGGRGERSAPSYQISRLSGIQPPKLSKYRILAINLPLRGH